MIFIIYHRYRYHLILYLFISTYIYFTKVNLPPLIIYHIMVHFHLITILFFRFLFMDINIFLIFNERKEIQINLLKKKKQEQEQKTKLNRRHRGILLSSFCSCIWESRLLLLCVVHHAYNDQPALLKIHQQYFHEYVHKYRHSQFVCDSVLEIPCRCDLLIRIQLYHINEMLNRNKIVN
jgi:hypothetical protein